MSSFWPQAVAAPAILPLEKSWDDFDMENIATSVRIAGDAIVVLASLSAKLGQSKAQVLEIALKQLEERIFWEEVRESFAKIAANPEDAARQKAEVQLWDQGTAREFRPEDAGDEW